MTLPSAPSTYNLRDQDNIRRILEQGLDDTLARLLALEASPPTPGNVPTAMPVGMWDAFSIIGKGPQGTTTPPLYTWAHGIPANLNQSDLPALLASAKAAGVHLMLNLAHSPGAYTDTSGTCKNFNQAKYMQLLNAAAVFPEVKAALAPDADGQRAASVLVVDEPLATYYCGTFPRPKVNEMGLATKALFPGAATIVRAGTGVFSFADIPPGGWTGIDYGIAQYGRFPVGSTIPGELPGAYFTRQTDELAKSGVGVVVGTNIWDGGGSDHTCWDYLATGSSSGRIHGSIATNNNPGVNPGDGEPCATAPVGKYYMSYPALIHEIVDAIAKHPYVSKWPFFGMWTHTKVQPIPVATFQGFEARTQFKNEFTYAIQTLGARTKWDGWKVK